MLTRESVESMVLDTIRNVGWQRGMDVPDLRPRLRLVDELGFKSLDVARMIAMLELRLGLDPFSRLISVTNVRTVGDLCNAYVRALDDPEHGTPGRMTQYAD